MSESQHERRSHAERRRLLQTLACLGVASSGLAPRSAAAQDFPNRPLRMVVPFPAGGPTDLVARPLAYLLSLSLHQQVIIDNKGGAGGSIAADGVAKSVPDGYTLLMGTVGTHAINSAVYKKLPYDPLKDFVPLGLVASAPIAVVVGAATPYGNVEALIAAARKQPGEITFASAGNGTPGHLTGEMFAKAAGISLRHVRYRGSAPAIIDVVGGQIPLMFDPVQSILPQVQAGRLRALAVTSRARSNVLPQVPSFPPPKRRCCVWKSNASSARPSSERNSEISVFRQRRRCAALLPTSTGPSWRNGERPRAIPARRWIEQSRRRSKQT
jgi:tripartite-type tricarboxylate transporter receptor subunit TctC